MNTILKRLQCFFEMGCGEKRSKRDFYMLYTVLFMIVSFFVFSWYLLGGRNFIYDHDGIYQHYKALIYYADYMRRILRGLWVDHKLVIPQWSFCTGEGSDILQTFHYYVIGDPYSFFAFLVPAKYMHIFYNVMVLLRIYSAGITFSMLCFYTGKKNRYGIMAGAFTYIFCFWVLLNAARHMFFLNPLIYMPLIVMGIEQILKREKPYLYIFTIFIAAISNFYFFYIIVWMTVIYVVVRLINLYRFRLKSWGVEILRIFGYSLLGTLMSSVILLPSLAAFLGDGRMESARAFFLVYPFGYYTGMAKLVLSPGTSYWMCMGYTAPTVLAFVLLFRRKGNRFLKGLFFSCLILMMFPFLGQVLNGLAYEANRWSWGMALLAAYILVEMWDELMQLTMKDAKALILVSAVFYAVCMLLERSRTFGAMVSIALMLFFLILILPKVPLDKKGREQRQILALLLVFVCIGTNAFVWFSGVSMNEAEEDDDSAYAHTGMRTEDLLEEVNNNEVEGLKTLLREENVNTRLVRYTGSDLTKNANCIEGISSTGYYWSISNPYVTAFRKSLGITGFAPHSYMGYNGSTILSAMSSSGYYITDEENLAVPYGYEFVDTINVNEDKTEKAKSNLRQELGVEKLTDLQIETIEELTAKTYNYYVNDHALPLVYTAKSVMDEAEWQNGDFVQRQEDFLSGAVIADYEGTLPAAEHDHQSYSVEYEVADDNPAVSRIDHGFVVTEANSWVDVKIIGKIKAKSELYLTMRGLNFQSVQGAALYKMNSSLAGNGLHGETIWNLLPEETQDDMIQSALYADERDSTTLQVKTPDGQKSNIYYDGPQSVRYYGITDSNTNMGYFEEPITTFRIRFSKTGIYTFDSMTLTGLPLEGYEKKIEAFTEDLPEEVSISNNQVKGTITLKENRLLCISESYADGWTAYIDDQPTTLYRMDLRYMAIDMPAGTHTFRLVYHTPLLKIGAIVTLLSFLGYGILILVRERR